MADEYQPFASDGVLGEARGPLGGLAQTMLCLDRYLADIEASKVTGKPFAAVATFDQIIANLEGMHENLGTVIQRWRKMANELTKALDQEEGRDDGNT